jgi:hypothetical protein
VGAAAGAVWLLAPGAVQALLRPAAAAPLVAQATAPLAASTEAAAVQPTAVPPTAIRPPTSAPEPSPAADGELELSNGLVLAGLDDTARILEAGTYTLLADWRVGEPIFTSEEQDGRLRDEVYYRLELLGSTWLRWS